MLLTISSYIVAYQFYLFALERPKNIKPFLLAFFRRVFIEGDLLERKFEEMTSLARMMNNKP